MDEVITEIYLDGSTCANHIRVTKDVKMGTVIIDEDAFLSVPDPGNKFWGTDSEEVLDYTSLREGLRNMRVCVGCYCSLPTVNNSRCETCSSPLCSTSCPEISNHSQKECKMLENIRKDQTVAEFIDSDIVQGQIYYDFVAVIRFLLFKQQTLPNAMALACLTPIDDNYRSAMFLNNESGELALTRLFETIDRSWFASSENIKTDVDVDGMVEYGFTILNTLKRRGISHNAQENNLVRFYSSLASFIGDSCLPNVEISTSKSGGIKVRALQNITKHTQLTACFVNIMRPTYDRHMALATHRLSGCWCRRCLDPTELETYIGSLRCGARPCCNGKLIFQFSRQMKEKAFLNGGTWQCDYCGSTTSHDYVLGTIEKYSSKMNEIDQNDFVKIENFVKELIHPTTQFYPNHWLVIFAKKKLTDVMGISYGIRTWSIETKLLLRKMVLLKENLQTYMSLKHGLSSSAAQVKAKILDLQYLQWRIHQSQGRLDFNDLTDEKKEQLQGLALEIWTAVRHCDPLSIFGDTKVMANYFLSKQNKDSNLLSEFLKR